MQFQDYTYEDYIEYCQSLFPKGMSSDDFYLLISQGLGLSRTALKIEAEKSSEDTVRLVNRLFEECKKDDLVEEYLIQQQKQVKYLFFTAPILRYFMPGFRDKLSQFNSIDTEERFVTSILEHVSYIILDASLRTLILEMHVLKEENKLLGETSEERHAFFTDTILKDPDYVKQIYLEYLELSTFLMKRTQYYLDYVLQIMHNTTDNIVEIEKTVNSGNSLGLIKRIKFGQGDSHNMGKTVAIIEFVDDTKVVYKPRSVEMEKAYFKFSNWLSQYFDKKNVLKAGKTVGNDQYGWMEFIEYKQCDSSDDFSKFYYNSGVLLLVLYLLNGSDFHFENIIAYKDYPVPIDLETLLNNYENVQDQLKDSMGIGFDAIGQSVTPIGLLPHPQSHFIEGEEYIFDLSALNSDLEIKLPVHTYSNIHSDEMNIAVNEIARKDRFNIPFCNSNRPQSIDYIEDVIAGFTYAYDAVLANKKLVEENAISAFDNVHYRYILKDTNQYAQLLTTSLHPDFLRESLTRKIVLCRIGQVNTQTHLRAINAEVNDLYNGDIPFFAMRTNSPNLWDSSDTLHVDYFTRSC